MTKEEALKEAKCRWGETAWVEQEFFTCPELAFMRDLSGYYIGYTKETHHKLFWRFSWVKRERITMGSSLVRDVLYGRDSRICWENAFLNVEARELAKKKDEEAISKIVENFKQNSCVCKNG